MRRAVPLRQAHRSAYFRCLASARYHEGGRHAEGLVHRRRISWSSREESDGASMLSGELAAYAATRAVSASTAPLDVIEEGRDGDVDRDPHAGAPPTGAPSRRPISRGCRPAATLELDGRGKDSPQPRSTRRGLLRGSRRKERCDGRTRSSAGLLPRPAITVVGEPDNPVLMDGMPGGVLESSVEVPGRRQLSRTACTRLLPRVDEPFRRNRGTGAKPCLKGPLTEDPRRVSRPSPQLHGRADGRQGCAIRPPCGDPRTRHSDSHGDLVERP